MDENKLKDLAKSIESNAKRIEDNAKNIKKNTGALELLHTINDCKKRYFTMWLYTFTAFLAAIGYIIYLLNK